MKLKSVLFRRPPFSAAGLAGLCAVAFLQTATAYGPAGHQTVGAIADRLIAGTPAETHVRALIGAETLEVASTWADRVKGGSLTPEMQAFVTRNPNHHQYHYTDIPIEEPAYRDSSVGANGEDVVHMIRRCIAILQGTTDPKITQKEALRLLVHFVGDLHQPLHVGAGYFDATDHLANPNVVAGTAETRGGGRIRFRSNMHSYWDTKAVQLAMTQAGAATPRMFAQQLTATAPTGVNAGGFLSRMSRTWANEMLPVAKEAHLKLNFGPRIMVGSPERQHAEWPASTANNNAYDTWAAQVTKRDLALGGYRLAALLKRIWPH